MAREALESGKGLEQNPHLVSAQLDLAVHNLACWLWDDCTAVLGVHTVFAAGDLLTRFRLLVSPVDARLIKQS